MRQHNKFQSYGEAENLQKHVTLSVPGGKLGGEWRAGTLEVKGGSGCSNRGETKYSCIFRCQVCSILSNQQSSWCFFWFFNHIQLSIPTSNGWVPLSFLVCLSILHGKHVHWVSHDCKMSCLNFRNFDLCRETGRAAWVMLSRVAVAMVRQSTKHSPNRRPALLRSIST